ncbi:MAG: hypothetical protein ACLFWI_13995 [Coleofasciculus sp.]|uniref:hypothetical protein n=1 Tax=Coleofasciculus sp. TaxID=3100458 RepID=UPI003A2C8FC9
MPFSLTLQEAAVWKKSDNTYKVVAYHPNPVAVYFKTVTSIVQILVQLPSIT